MQVHNICDQFHLLFNVHMFNSMDFIWYSFTRAKAFIRNLSMCIQHWIFVNSHGHIFSLIKHKCVCIYAFICLNHHNLTNTEKSVYYGFCFVRRGMALCVCVLVLKLYFNLYVYTKVSFFASFTLSFQYICLSDMEYVEIVFAKEILSTSKLIKLL